MRFEHSSPSKGKTKVSNDKTVFSSDKLLEPHKKGKFDLKREIFSWIETLLFSLVAVSLFITCMARMTPVDGSSMYPTLHDKDRIISTSIHGGYKRNDIIVAKRKDDTPIVKRIIAIEGDTIDIDFDTGEVFLNGELLIEEFINEPTTTRHNFNGPITIPKGHVFVMGDNRNYSDDSRVSRIGLIDERNIFGKVIFKIFPLSRFGAV